MPRYGLNVALLAASLMAADVGLSQQPIQPTEYELKAAFIYNFAKFTEWPSNVLPSINVPLVVGVLGEDPVEAALKRALEGKTIEKRRLLFTPFASAAEASTNCHILFISSSEQERLPQILKDLGAASVLTVAEMQQFTEKGGMINFVRQESMEGTKIRFQINDAAAKKAGLTVRSKLLSLALRPPK